ncbi:MAG TPA: pyridoxamine 5'-phosphate oxidase family protein [Caldilineaceae bacterium]|nr:pyridoxamine 5'-phosphate oxidase family protein [Caldilineaceae bacterium]
MMSVMLDYTPPQKTGRLTLEELEAFLAQPWNARLATVTPELRPYVVPVWYAYAPATRLFYVIGRERSAYVQHIRHNPAVALHIADDIHLAHTRVLVEGRAAIVEGPVAPASSRRLGSMVDDMARRYMGEPGPTYAAHTKERPRVLVEITPERWHSWTGGEWAARYFRPASE